MNMWMRLFALSALVLTSALAQSSLSLGTGSGKPGETVVLDLALSSPAGLEPAAIQWTINFQAAAFSVVTASAGPAGIAASKTVSCRATSGQVACAAYGLAAGAFNAYRIANGVLARVSLSIATGIGSSTQFISLTSTLGATPIGDSLTTTGAAGSVSIIGVAVSRCDVNADGVVDVNDLTLTVSQVIGDVPCASGDINRDGVCNVADVQRVIQAGFGQPCRET